MNSMDSSNPRRSTFRPAGGRSRDAAPAPRSSIEQISAEQPLPDAAESIVLLQRHKAGDGHALQELVSRYQDRLRRIVRIKLVGRVRAHYESMDIVQDVNMIMMRKLGEVEAEDSGAILNWLSEVVLNRVRNTDKYLRALKRDVDRNMEIEIDLGGGSTTISLPALDEEALPPEEAYKAEVREILDDSMAELPENYREVILLRDYAGASWDYVARERGTSVPAAEQLYRRAWIRLRRIARPRLDAAQPPSEG